VVSVATWNLWWRFGDWQARRRIIERVLREERPDIVALQEVWHTADTDFAHELGAALGYFVCFEASPAPQKWQRKIRDDTVGIGNAVLSRWRIDHAVSARLPAGDAPDEGRVALCARIDSPYGRIALCCAHLNSGWAQSSIRKTQLAAAGRLLADNLTGEFPPILCGDFNADVDFDEIRALSGKTDPLVDGLALLDLWWVLRPDEAGWTWDRRNPHVAAVGEPSARIDYLFAGYPKADGAGRPLSIRLMADQQFDQLWASDHFGLIAELASSTAASQ
jgi:endonuclease/exonuclease/phosphatase family metal-dependent hydrolase